jgi:hypothetical protein
MNRLMIPIVLIVAVIVLLSIQCTVIWRFPVWGIHLELLPPLLLYAAFTVNLPTAFLLGLLSAGMYDSFSGGYFGASVIPYFVSIALFSGLRPIFFRDRMTTQILSGFIFGWIVLILQWVLSGKFGAVSWSGVLPKLMRLAFFSGLLSVLYFILLDGFFRFLGLEPGRFEDDIL